ncbi:Uncharacterised protein [Lelliottia amnigena]|nr:hypothetical protein CCAJJPOJ_02922 [Lelliottia sp. T2.26D-8]VDZ86927.1 Uncharacterised protein [Lelliottia amnigena]
MALMVQISQGMYSMSLTKMGQFGSWMVKLVKLLILANSSHSKC